MPPVNCSAGNPTKAAHDSSHPSREPDCRACLLAGKGWRPRKRADRSPDTRGGNLSSVRGPFPFFGGLCYYPLRRSSWPIFPPSPLRDRGLFRGRTERGLAEQSATLPHWRTRVSALHRPLPPVLCLQALRLFTVPETWKRSPSSPRGEETASRGSGSCFWRRGSPRTLEGGTVPVSGGRCPFFGGLCNYPLQK